ncbi:MAG: glycoside hydrolase family 2 protein, partial [Lachnospiraceae bacterium]|nr:glycoside hydrolase family 2 protein [Lachnospiraceae bacterium]
YISYRFVKDEEVLSAGTTLFTPPKHFKFQNPGLELRAEGNTLKVTAKAYAKNVEILALDGDVRFSDNYFDMDAGETEVTIVSGAATQFAVRSVYDIA